MSCSTIGLHPKGKPIVGRDIISKLITSWEIVLCIFPNGTFYFKASLWCLIYKKVYINLSGVIGSSLMRFPVALNTALAMAGAIPTKAISPSPFDPMGLR